MFKPPPPTSVYLPWSLILFFTHHPSPFTHPPARSSPRTPLPVWGAWIISHLMKESSVSPFDTVSFSVWKRPRSLAFPHSESLSEVISTAPLTREHRGGGRREIGEWAGWSYDVVVLHGFMAVCSNFSPGLESPIWPVNKSRQPRQALCEKQPNQLTRAQGQLPGSNFQWQTSNSAQGPLRGQDALTLTLLRGAARDGSSNYSQAPASPVPQIPVFLLPLVCISLSAPWSPRPSTTSDELAWVKEYVFNSSHFSNVCTPKRSTHKVPSPTAHMCALTLSLFGSSTEQTMTDWLTDWPHSTLSVMMESVLLYFSWSRLFQSVGFCLSSKMNGHSFHREDLIVCNCANTHGRCTLQLSYYCLYYGEAIHFISLSIVYFTWAEI